MKRRRFAKGSVGAREPLAAEGHGQDPGHYELMNFTPAARAPSAFERSGETARPQSRQERPAWRN
jgi:hypothetical protein